MSKRGDTQIALTMEDVKNIAQFFEENGYETAYVGKWHLASESRVGRCIHTPKYLYSVYAPDKDGWKDKDSDYYEEDFLYDLEKDPYELHNLIYDKEYEDVRKQLAEELKEEMAKAGEKVPVICSSSD